MNAAQILKDAKAHISDPAMWCKGQFFASAPGKDLPDLDPHTFPNCPSCAFGAVAYAAKAPRSKADEYLTRAAREWSNQSVVDFNDDSETTHADIMTLFDRAIALAEKEGEA